LQRFGRISYPIGMLDYLIDREHEEMLRVSSRTLTFPDGETRRIEAYRLVWAWFDRIVASSHVTDEAKLLEMTLAWANEKAVPLETAFGQLIECVVKTGETLGVDYTDDTIPLTIARDQIARFHSRKERRQG